MAPKKKAAKKLRLAPEKIAEVIAHMAPEEKADKKPWKEPRLPAEKISELALGIFQARIFTSGMIDKADWRLLPCIFMPLGFMDEKQRAEFLRHPPALMYGPLDSACPRSINGYPFLTEMGMVYEQDQKLLVHKFKALVAAAEEALKS